MAVQLRVEDRLQGAQNFPTWKERIMKILDVSDAKDYIDSMKVAPIDSTEMVRWKKLYSRVGLIILDGVKDHIVPHLSGKKTTLEMWKALVVLQERMSSTKMAKGEGVVPYLTRLTQIRTNLEQRVLRLKMRS